jgi:GxxExxY protein
LCQELKFRAIEHRRQVALPVVYKGITLDTNFFMDIVVGDQLVIELKAVEKLLPIHEAQLLTYLKLSGIRVGLLLNFHVPVLKNGIKRLIL